MLFALSAMLLASCDRPKAELKFYETCSNEEINDKVYKPLFELDKELNDADKASLNTLLNAGGFMRESMVGYSNPQDTAAINALIELAYSKGLLNRDEVLLMWLNNSESQELYALKPTADGGAAMEGDILQSAEARLGFGGAPIIYVEFTPEAADTFADLSEKNVGNGIAIVINGCLRCVPFVQCRIDGGKVEISGNFTEEETKEFAEALSPGWRRLLPF